MPALIKGYCFYTNGTPRWGFFRSDMYILPTARPTGAFSTNGTLIVRDDCSYTDQETNMSLQKLLE